MLACEATLGRGSFAQFRFPTGPLQLNLENAMSDSLGFAGNSLRVRSPLQAETAGLFVFGWTYRIIWYRNFVLQ